MLNGLCRSIDVLTEAEIGPSWADLPLTLKVTPLGALDLTSRLAATAVSLQPKQDRTEKAQLTCCGMIEIFVQDLLASISASRTGKLPFAVCSESMGRTSLAGLPISLNATGSGTATPDMVSDCRLDELDMVLEKILVGSD